MKVELCLCGVGGNRIELDVTKEQLDFLKAIIDKFETSLDAERSCPALWMREL